MARSRSHKLKLLVFLLALSGVVSMAVQGQTPELSDRAKGLDSNNNNLVERDEARGPLQANFDDIDCDGNGGLDGAEIPAFFKGTGCPQTADESNTKAAVADEPPPLSERARGLDTNGNNLVDRDEARGPLQANFDEMDCDGNNALDGAEIPAFFQGAGCPEKKMAPKPLGQTAEQPKPATGQGSKASGGRPPQAVSIDQVRLEYTEETYSVVGRVVSNQSGPLAARISGAIESIKVAVGERVTKGDEIATISRSRLIAEKKRLEAQVNRHRVMVRNALRELKRMEKLKGSSALSQSNFENQEGLVAERQAQLLEQQVAAERVDIDIQDATITAPYSGIVMARHVVEGAYVNPGARVVTLLNDQRLEVEADVPSQRVVGLTPGTDATVVVGDAIRLTASVRAIIPTENVRTRSRPVRLTVAYDSSSMSLASNQSVIVELPLTQGNRILTVHKDAVMRRANGNIVFVVEGDSAKMRFVKLGRGVGDKFQVLEGLEDGEQVVVRGNERLGAGGKVRVVGG